MKIVKRLVTEDTTQTKPKQAFNDYYADTVVGVNGLQKPASNAEIGDTLDGKGQIINIATFEYGDDENPEVLAA